MQHKTRGRVGGLDTRTGHNITSFGTSWAPNVANKSKIQLKKCVGHGAHCPRDQEVISHILDGRLRHDKKTSQKGSSVEYRHNVSHILYVVCTLSMYKHVGCP